MTGRAFAFEQIPKASQVAGAAGGVGVAVLITSRHVDLQPRQLLGAEPHDEQARLAPEVADAVLQRHGEHGIGPDVRRPHRARATARTAAATSRRSDTKTGASLWKSPPMDAPATAPPVTYSVNGKQYVSILVGGQATTTPTGRTASRHPTGCAATASTPSRCRNKKKKKKKIKGARIKVIPNLNMRGAPCVSANCRARPIPRNPTRRSGGGSERTCVEY